MSCSPRAEERSASASRWAPWSTAAAEYRGTPVPGTGGLITEDLTIENWLLNAGVGPQVMARSGPVRPYAYALAGLGYFATDTTLGNDYYPASIGSTNYDDTTFAWCAGAGLLVSVSRSFAIDLGVQYVGNGTVRYLAEGDLLPSPGGAPPVIVPRKTEANLVFVHRRGDASGRGELPTIRFVIGLERTHRTRTYPLTSGASEADLSSHQRATPPRWSDRRGRGASGLADRTACGERRGGCRWEIGSTPPALEGTFGSLR